MNVIDNNQFFINFRFLFPIYPLICLCGAVTIDIFQKLWFRAVSFFKEITPGSHYLDYGMFITIGTIVISSFLGKIIIKFIFKHILSEQFYLNRS